MTVFNRFLDCARNDGVDSRFRRNDNFKGVQCTLYNLGPRQTGSLSTTYRDAGREEIVLSF